jgi:hypothetical protein
MRQVFLTPNGMILCSIGEHASVDKLSGVTYREAHD